MRFGKPKLIGRLASHQQCTLAIRRRLEQRFEIHLDTADHVSQAFTLARIGSFPLPGQQCLDIGLQTREQITYRRLFEHPEHTGQTMQDHWHRLQTSHLTGVETDAQRFLDPGQLDEDLIERDLQILSVLAFRHDGLVGLRCVLRRTRRREHRQGRLYRQQIPGQLVELGIIGWLTLFHHIADHIGMRHQPATQPALTDHPQRIGRAPNGLGE